MYFHILKANSLFNRTSDGYLYFPDSEVLPIKYLMDLMKFRDYITKVVGYPVSVDKDVSGKHGERRERERATRASLQITTREMRGMLTRTSCGEEQTKEQTEEESRGSKDGDILINIPRY